MLFSYATTVSSKIDSMIINNVPWISYGKRLARIVQVKRALGGYSEPTRYVSSISPVY